LHNALTAAWVFVESWLAPPMGDDCRNFSATIACTIFEPQKISQCNDFACPEALQPWTKL
jgi:hypothetical protein